MNIWEQRYFAGALCMAVLSLNDQSGGAVWDIIATVFWPLTVIGAMYLGVTT